MDVIVLGATGATGKLLVRQALERGHTVTAIARDPSRIDVPPHERLTPAAADVWLPETVARAARNGGVLLSGLGQAGGDRPGVLAAGARAAVASSVDRVIWLGAYGTGPSAAAAGALTRTLVKVFMKSELDDKVAADAAVLAAGGTVFHAGMMADGPAGQGWRGVALEQAPRRSFPAKVPRATLAALMLDEAETKENPGRVVIPVP